MKPMLVNIHRLQVVPYNMNESKVEAIYRHYRFTLIINEQQAASVICYIFCNFASALSDTRISLHFFPSFSSGLLTLHSLRTSYAFHNFACDTIEVCIISSLFYPLTCQHIYSGSTSYKSHNFVSALLDTSGFHGVFFFYFFIL